MVRHKGIVVMREHDPQGISYEWLCLQMEVREHLVAVPAANQIDDVAVY